MPPLEPQAIESENTLAMIQQALASNPNDLGDDGAGLPTKAPAKKKGFKKKVVKKKERPDQVTRFFNNYGENPHLQQIENGYLRHLEAQHAKEAHLKEIKKFQILYALKTI